MDIDKLLKNVSNLNNYIATTQDATEKCKNSKLQLNMSTVLELKKIRSLEIEYFNKCEENGIGCVIFERILSLPPSKTWGVLGKELVMLLQYWLDAVRKHLVKHNQHWWTFMKLLLSFLQEIRTKDVSLPDTLVEQTAECLLDLATNDRPDAIQRHHILHCLNMFSSECSRKLRFALRNGFSNYFVKLAVVMSTCGYLPCQYSILETLLRWLLPRQDRALRQVAAAEWFPRTLYSEPVAKVFLESTWLNFFQDARDLLNAHNSAGDLITSVVCRRLAVGNVVIISGTEKQDAWLDINLPNRCISVLLDPRVLEAFGSTNHKTFDTLVISDEITQCAKLYRQDKRLIISVTTLRPPRVLTATVAAGDSRDVTIVVTSRDTRRLDAALRAIFADKYQILLDLDKDLSLSPQSGQERIDKSHTYQEDPRFSHPVETKRRVRSGYIVKQYQPANWKSPSTASTTSLAQLHDKLAALPHYRYDKKPFSVCALPDLSVVSEHSETDDRLSNRYKPSGVYYRRRIAPAKSPTQKSQSDGDNRIDKRNKPISPVASDNNDVSCLLVATIGSADDSVINDTVERLTRRKDFHRENIVDLLMQEALEASVEKSEIKDIGDGKTRLVSADAEIVENTPGLQGNKIQEELVVIKGNDRRTTKVVDSTSTDESNTEYINETPQIDFVNVRTRKKIRNEVDTSEKQSFDERIVEDFFAQHFAENKAGDVVVSPILARKLNETSSEMSDFDGNFILMKDNYDLDVIECLNCMVDQVCDEFDKCTEYLNKANDISAIVDPIETGRDSLPLQDIINTVHDIEAKKKTPKKAKPKSKSIKLKYKITPRKTRGRPRKEKLVLESTSKMSTITEDITVINNKAVDIQETVTKNNDTIIGINKENNDTNANVDEVSKDNDEIIAVINGTVDVTDKNEDTINRNSNTPLLRRKRKLYSPKDDFNKKSLFVSETEEDDITVSEFKLKKTPKSKATCYKDIAKDRQRHIRVPRNRKCKGGSDIPSPRTKKKNDIFDKLKETSEGEKVILADKTSNIEVYNFTSDSEDDDFKKKIDARKPNSTTTVGSLESGRSITRKVNGLGNKLENKTKRKGTRRKNTKTKIIGSANALEDERMREAKDVLNTSIVVERAVIPSHELELSLKEPPVMEMINDTAIEKPNATTRKTRKNAKNIKTERAESKKPNKKTNNISYLQDDRTESPLPGLVVEPILDTNNEVDLSAHIFDKFKKIYQAGPDSNVVTNTTQNLLLSDIEKVDSTTNNINITDEMYQIDDQIEYDTIANNVITTRSVSRCKNTKTDMDTDTNRKSKGSKRTRASTEAIKLSEVNSERSIATQGITAHGDFDETPPRSPDEEMQFRDIEDLDQSIKDYFNELTKGIICRSNNDSYDSYTKNLRDTARSPVVSIKRLSPKVIRDLTKNMVRSETSASPVVPLKRLSTKDIRKWLPSSRNSDTDSMKTNVSLNKSIIKRGATDSDDKSKKKSSRVDGNFRSALGNGVSTIASENNSFDEMRVITRNTGDSGKNLSIISPIKLFDDLRSNGHNESVDTCLSDDEEYMRLIKDTVSKNDLRALRNRNDKRDASSKSDIKTSRNDSTKRDTRAKRDVKSLKNATEGKDQKSSSKSWQNGNEKRYTLFKSDFKCLHDAHDKTLSTSQSSSKTNISTSTKKLDTLKRVSSHVRVVKKMKVDANEVVNLRSGSASSIHDWFIRNEPNINREDMVDASVKDTLEHILEKLDTTLLEVQHNTSRRFVHLFVNAQRHLKELKKKNRAKCRELVTDMNKQFCQILNQIADLDKQSRDTSDDFMKQLKEQASELIRDDFKQKEAMVRLLREDVQTVFVHLRNCGEAP